MYLSLEMTKKSLCLSHRAMSAAAVAIDMLQGNHYLVVKKEETAERLFLGVISRGQNIPSPPAVANSTQIQVQIHDLLSSREQCVTNAFV